ncbi:phospholipase D-like domain-containing protein [Croceicoccus naphthovorans]|uniref:Phospholipase D n=1 Tax=Croceicoccus naphthovorans TaxID=1348774 RepID=A0A0G3XGQ9_9SPHN|nr:phospholipase D-like domain-containing protein [Croceicoccus naphthovorans]AKM10392.1 phospholipase D [Croceicoccus naphthovorans]MBB3990089.1 phosphatidylserine/phosphatidylglycerophosphate/cardiolipin synthase-like enzyme [Croceicoccus naphthovorans]
MTDKVVRPDQPDGPAGNKANDPGSAFAQSVEPGVWRFEHADKAKVIVDAADYFTIMQDVMMRAKKRIFLIGWDFDTRIALGRGRRWWQRRPKSHPPRRLGRFIVWLANRNPDLEIYVLKWNFGAVKMFFRGSMLIDMWRWFRHDRINFKFDAAHPVGCSHHQKIVIVDDRFAVCGGIDMTADRWDTREHLDKDRLRREPGGGTYMPWHDMTMLVEGDVARALDDLGRKRWNIASGSDLAPVPAQPHSVWPDDLDPSFDNIKLGIARTRATFEDCEEIREIETLFLSLIKRAKKFIYAESQYFASRKIGEAIAERMAEDDPPEIVLVNPEEADGWLEQQAMDTARARLLKAIGKVDTKQRFRVYIPRTAGDNPIYVHAKLMIVDDQVLKLGSANMNNRSLGLDSECDLLLDATRFDNGDEVAKIRALRHDLLAEHMGLDPAEIGPLIEQYGSMHAMIQNHPQPGRALRLYEMPKLNGVEKALADDEWLDPESADDMFEPISERKGLFRRIRRPK